VESYPARGVVFVAESAAAPLHATYVSCNSWGMATSTRRASEYRRRMRERGYRPVQVWVPDVRSARFTAEAHREALALAEADRHSDDMDFVEAISVQVEDE
jgi:Protein  of unknown function (DUF3018)